MTPTFMDVPIFFAKFFAVLYLCIGFGALFNKKHFRKVLEEFHKNTGLDYLAAIVSVILGFLMVSAYNVWTWNWTVLITIFGWMALLKGVIHLLFPEFSMKMIERLLKSKLVETAGPVCIIIGVIFAYFGMRP